RMPDKVSSSIGVALLVPLLAGLLGAQAKVREKDLSPKYQEWLKLTTTFILPAEREVFLALSDDRERDIFIEAFWKQRDPTEGTPPNEYKDEMEARFKYVNEYFRRGTVREGWMTDMGRIHMILGAPRSIERFEGNAGLYPVQVWYYYGDAAKGLPANFVMIFFQRGGGEFKLYNPISDGPGSFIVDTRGLDLTDHQAMYDKIRELAPTLATVSLSLVPGQIPYGYMPSPQASLILAKVFDSPKKDINPAYATHFLNYRGIVSTEYLTNYIESDATVEIVRDAILGLDFLHFAISPRKASIDYYQPKDQYYCNFKLSVSLRRGDAVVFQYSRDYPFYFPADRVANVQANGIAVQDLFPVAEGTFALSILLQNAVGKEFSLLERSIEVPAADGPVALADPIVGYGLRDAAGASGVPFKVLGREILTDPRGTLCLSDDLAFAVGVLRLPRELWSEGAIEIAAAGAGPEGKTFPVQTIKLTDLPYARALTFTGKIAARGLTPDYYELAVTLKNGKGEAVDQAKSPFILSPVTAVPHPVTVVKPLPAANNHLYYYGLAIQYDKLGDRARTEALLEKAHAMRPDYLEGVVQFADFLVRAGKPDRALEVAEELAGAERFRFDYGLLKGQALKEKGEYAAAIPVLLEGNKIYNSDTRLLNTLGFCFYRTGQKQQALDALNASLRLNPGQKDIAELKGRVEKELK
ncbi:MAG TPA: GWxTD domain-containing protein, partial [Acidobacteriota bacterium]|nr:GWxTD domain-containing protein [Acidobacteriota bacterium]